MPLFLGLVLRAAVFLNLCFTDFCTFRTTVSKCPSFFDLVVYFGFKPDFCHTCSIQDNTKGPGTIFLGQLFEVSVAFHVTYTWEAYIT